jgi:hypothetical protein
MFLQGETGLASSRVAGKIGGEGVLAPAVGKGSVPGRTCGLFWGGAMSTGEGEIRTRFDELKPGDRIEVERTVVAAERGRPTRVCGTVIRTERRRHGPARFGGPRDPGFQDVILLELCDGELTAVTMDDTTVLRRA